jgi:hypothetical protein
MAGYDAIMALAAERDMALKRAKAAIWQRYYKRLHRLLDAK